MNGITENMTKLQTIMMAAIIPVIVVAATLLVGLIVRGIVFSRLLKNRNALGRTITKILKGPVIIWFLMLGIYFAIGSSKLPENVIFVAGKILLALGIFSITLVTVNLSSAMIAKYSVRIEAVLPITSLTQNISRIVIFAIGGLVVLNTLGISITPIIATLGVGGLAVAMALQDTLGNVFAGFYIIVSRQIKIGDYIKLDSGEEGYVTDITWRTTKIKTLPNNVILIPNEKLTKTIATNYCLPEREISVPIQVGVHYNSDLEMVEKITCEVGREIMNQTQGGVPGFEPVVRYHTFADSSINFTVILRVKEFVDQYFIKHEFIKRLHKRYAKEGIVIPYPIRAINYTQEKAASDSKPQNNI